MRADAKIGLALLISAALYVGGRMAVALLRPPWDDVAAHVAALGVLGVAAAVAVGAAVGLAALGRRR